jgi:flavodoxin
VKEMKILIAYYSRTGNNERIAYELQKKLNCDIEKIVDTVNRKGFLGFLKSGRAARNKEMSKIVPIEKDPSAYDAVIVACPFWAGNIPPPIRTYISENKDKFNRFALVSVCAAGEGNEKAIPDYEAILGKKVMAHLLLKQNELKHGDYEKELQEFSEAVLSLTES